MQNNVDKSILYILTHIACADSHFHEKEEKMIRGIWKKLMHNNEKANRIVDEVFEEYSNDSRENKVNEKLALSELALSNHKVLKVSRENLILLFGLISIADGSIDERESGIIYDIGRKLDLEEEAHNIIENLRCIQSSGGIPELMLQLDI